MRIVYVGPVPPLPGGISHSGAELTAALRRAGHEVEIISWAAQYPRLLYKGSARDKGAVAPEGAEFVMRWWAPWSWWRAGRQARGADLLVLPWVTPAQAPAYCVVLAAARRVPRLVVVHNPYPHEPRALDTVLTRVVLRQADVLLAHSAAAAASISTLAPDVTVETAPLPPTLTITPQPLPPHPPYKALFFGLVRPYKGLDIAIDALAILRARGVPIELTVAGEFWEPVDPWNARIAAAGLTDAVHLHPRLCTRRGGQRAARRAPHRVRPVPLGDAIGRRAPGVGGRSAHRRNAGRGLGRAGGRRQERCAGHRGDRRRVCRRRDHSHRQPRRARDGRP